MLGSEASRYEASRKKFGRSSVVLAYEKVSSRKTERKTVTELTIVPSEQL